MCFSQHSETTAECAAQAVIVGYKAGGLEDDERVSFGAIEGAAVGATVQAVEWSDSIVDRCRFESTTITDSSFQRVIFRDSDLSGVTFVNCLLRDCLIIGVRARSYLGFDNCIIDNVTLARCQTDRFEFHNSSIAAIDFVRVASKQLTFHQSQAHKKSGRMSFANCDVDRVGGLEALGKAGLSVQLDIPMWRDLGDQLLKERGMQQLDGVAIAKQDDLIDEVSERLDHRGS
mgnify:CR=1 FL=1